MWHSGDILQTFRSGWSHFSTREHGAVCPGTRSTLRTEGELGSCVNVAVTVIDMVPLGTHADLVEGDQTESPHGNLTNWERFPNGGKCIDLKVSER